MSRNYKFKNPDGLYFVSFAVVEWVDVFTRNEYKDIFLDSLRYCQKEKGLEIIAWCIMTNHVPRYRTISDSVSCGKRFQVDSRTSAPKVLKTPPFPRDCIAWFDCIEWYVDCIALYGIR